jgi:uncharacterized MnhB-related membrane protein
MAALLLDRENFLQSAVIFIAFGLFMALAWVRLQAPDIALAEAAIGAGITGVLLMDAIRHMEWEKDILRQKWKRAASRQSRSRSSAKNPLVVGDAAIGRIAGRRSDRHA